MTDYFDTSSNHTTSTAAVTKQENEHPQISYLKYAQSYEDHRTAVVHAGLHAIARQTSCESASTTDIFGTPCSAIQIPPTTTTIITSQKYPTISFAEIPMERFCILDSNNDSVAWYARINMHATPDLPVTTLQESGTPDTSTKDNMEYQHESKL